MHSAIWRTLRPQQWTKNGLVFAALIFSKNLLDPSAIGRTTTAFILMCMLSSSMYIVNDILDREHDARHPKKKKRPIASGQLQIPVAMAIAIGLLAVGLPGAFLLSVSFGRVALAYAGLVLSYSIVLKHRVILDVIAIAIGFVLRAGAGAVVIAVEISPWLLLCTFLLAIFLALAKRRSELSILGDEPDYYRPVLRKYSPAFLDQMVSVATATTVIAYALYTMDSHTIEFFGTPNLIYTFPFVVYGIYRYLYLTYHKEMGSSPEMILLTDRGIILDIIGWVISVSLIIYW